VVVAPVQVAAYLDRPQIVTRVSEGEVHLAEFDRWAEPLADGVRRVLIENLSRLLASDRISESRAPAAARTEYRVNVSVTELELDRGSAMLKARWTVLGGSGVIAERLSAVQVEADGEDVASAVGAQSRALAKLSGEVAGAIRAASSRR